MNLNDIGRISLANALKKGFVDVPTPQAVALIHSEVSEVLEADRRGNPRSDKIPEFSSITEELADVILRTCDLAARLGLDLAGCS